MSISTTSNRAVYTGDGSSALFAFQYEFHAQSDLAVYIWNSSRTTVISTKVLNTDYTISGVADAQNRYTNGANVIFNSSPASTDYITIVRDTLPTNPFNLKFNQVLPNAELIKALDRLTMLEQRLADHTGTRSLRIRDAFPLTFNALLPAKLPAGAPIIVGSSGQTIETGVVAFNGTTAATYFGILPVNNGGTGLDLSLLPGILYSPGTNTTLDRVLNGGAGWVLTANGSSAPTFQTLAATLINSGIVAVSFGGTGTGTSYIQYGVVFASSATQMANTAAGGKDQPLVGNNGSAPTFQAINMASGSSVLGILSQANGGTGTASSFPLSGILFQQGNGTVGFIPSSVDGYGLASHGSSAPTFQPIVVSPVVPTTVSAANTLTTSITKMVLNSSGYNVQLYDAVGNGGREIEFLRTGTDLVNAINIVGSGTQGIGTFGSSIATWTIGEVFKLYSDNAKWQVAKHESWTPEISAGAVTITGTQVNPTKGTTIRDSWVWWRTGKFQNYRYELNLSAANGATGTGDYNVVNPVAGAVIDTTNVVTNSSLMGAGYPLTGTILGVGWGNQATGATRNPLAMYPATTTSFRIIWQGNGTWSAAVNPISNVINLTVLGQLPMVGWLP